MYLAINRTAISIGINHGLGKGIGAFVEPDLLGFQEIVFIAPFILRTTPQLGQQRVINPNIRHGLVPCIVYLDGIGNRIPLVYTVVRCGFSHVNRACYDTYAQERILGNRYFGVNSDLFSFLGIDSNSVMYLAINRTAISIGINHGSGKGIGAFVDPDLIGLQEIVFIAIFINDIHVGQTSW